MFKKIIFIFIFLFLTMGFVGAFEVPSEFEPAIGDIDCYTNNDDEDSGQMIEVLDEGVYNNVYLSEMGKDYIYDMNDDGTFEFDYNGFNPHSGIGKHYYINDHEYVVLFWNKDFSSDDNVLKELIAECDALNEDIEDEDI